MRYPDAARGSLPVHAAVLDCVARGEGAAGHVPHLIERHEQHLRGMLGETEGAAESGAPRGEES